LMQMNSLKKISRNPTTFNDILVFSARKFLVKKIFFSLITGPLAGMIPLCPGSLRSGSFPLYSSTSRFHLRRV
jgi:hypothetical protein